MMEIPLIVDSVGSDTNLRPSKRRKFYRKREDEEVAVNKDEGRNGAYASDHAHSQASKIDELVSSHGSLHIADAEQDDHHTLSAAELVLRRKAHRGRLGVEFNNVPSDRASSAPLEHSAVALQDNAPEMKTLNDRFTPQTGQVADVDKHM